MISNLIDTTIKTISSISLSKSSSSSSSTTILLASTTAAAATATILLTLQKQTNTNLIDLFMHQIFDRTYIYNICWEDPAIDRQILNISPSDVIFRICSAGDIVLDYAIEGPSKIVVCDLNKHQLYLFELKIRMLRDESLTYEEWWGIWGDSDVDVALKVWKRMRHTMSEGGRVWWDGRIERVFRKGFAWSGSTGFVTKWSLPCLSWLVGFNFHEWKEGGFEQDYIRENEEVFKRSGRWLRRLFPTFLAPFLGVPRNQIGPEFQTDEFYENFLKQIFFDPNFATQNYFYRFYYEGGFKCQRCCPRTLQREHFVALKANANCFEWHHATVQETMERVQPHSFTKLVLLDHMDWMSNRNVHDEWIALQRATAPGAQVLWRSAFATMDNKPFFNNVDIKDLSPEWYKKDRVKTYLGTFVAHMPKDPLPFIESRLSPCQESTVLSQLYTTTKMILHPILTMGNNHGNQHEDKMSDFYASQARGYDAVREKMLVARPDMMSAFGPIRQNHTWLDVGGGTGRNLHYVKAQLSNFDRIVVLDICPELLAIGEYNARKTFTKTQCDKISWICMDFNSVNVRDKLMAELGDDLNRGFDNITFSYSLSMIPEWEQALQSAKSLLSPFGRVLIADFDTFSLEGNTVKDHLIRLWYAQDGVRIDAKSRKVVNDVFSGGEFKTTIARFQRPLLGLNIPHYVACCRLTTVTCSKGFRSSQSLLSLKEAQEKLISLEEEQNAAASEEKKME